MATWSGIRLPGRWTGEGGEGSVETGNPGETEEGAELTLPRRVNSGAEGRTKNTEGAEPALQPSTENHVPVNSASKTRTAHATRQAHSQTASHDPASEWLPLAQKLTSGVRLLSTKMRSERLRFSPCGSGLCSTGCWLCAWRLVLFL